ncbi:MAG: hypothetical protein H0V70_30470 [Ktedonobacteraceae bacterium]|nr:hypothetical protein [Ktedonobacteraceae bacterium]
MENKKRNLCRDEPPPPHLVGQRFVYATGLRYSELGRLRAKDIHQEPDGQVWLEVAGWSDTPTRKVPVLAGYEAEVLEMTANPYIFGNFQLYPTHYGMQSLRRAYARQLYQQCLKTLEAADAVSTVMVALGHQRRQVVLRDYLRLDGTLSDNDPEEEAV